LALGMGGEEARCFGHGSGRRRAAVSVAAALRAREEGWLVMVAVSDARGPFYRRSRSVEVGARRWWRPAGTAGCLNGVRRRDAATRAARLAQVMRLLGQAGVG